MYLLYVKYSQRQHACMLPGACSTVCGKPTGIRQLCVGHPNRELALGEQYNDLICELNLTI